MTCCDGGMMDGWGWMLLGSVFWLILILGGIALVIWAVRRSTGSGGSTFPTGSMNSGDPALSALRERFARGEIDESEYRDRRSALLEEG